MRQFYTILLLVFFLSSCSPYYSGQYLTASKNSFSTIPMRPHTHEVDIFLDNERPVKPYYKIKLIEAQAGTNVSSDEMLIRLKQKAKEEGVDAVVVSDIGKQTNIATTLGYGESLISYQKLVGVGLKYKERIDYLETILKEQVISLWPDDNPAPKIFSMNYDFNGQNISLKNEFIRNFFYNEVYVYENEKSFYVPDEGWEFRMDTINQLFSKRRVANGIVYQESHFKLNYPDLLTAIIKTTDPGKATPEKFELRFTYRSNGLLTEKRLKKKKAVEDLWVEKIQYRLNGLPDKISRYKIVNGKEVLYFEIQNNYYSTKDLPPTDN